MQNKDNKKGPLGPFLLHSAIAWLPCLVVGLCVN